MDETKDSITLEANTMDIDPIEDFNEAPFLEGSDAAPIDIPDNSANPVIPSSTRLSISSHASVMPPGNDSVPLSRTSLDNVLDTKELSERQEVMPEGGDADTVQGESPKLSCGDEKPGEAETEAKEMDDKIYGGCEGPDAMYVKLISSDGHEFIVKREHALTSGTIKAMLSGPGQFAENETNEVNFREIPSHVLQKVCMYFTYKIRYTNSSTEIPEFPIAPEIALELLMAANFLDC